MTTPTRGRPQERTAQDNVPGSFRRSVSYIDTIQVVLEKRMSYAAFQRFWNSRCNEPGHCDHRYRARAIPTTGVFFIFRITLHQPTGAELYALGELEAAGKCKVTRVDVALDLLVRSTSSSDEVRRHIEERLMPSTRARHFVRNRAEQTLKRSVAERKETTYYFKDISEGTEIALYSDRHSKTGHGWQCCHLEFRVKGSKALSASRLSSLMDVYSLDHREFWNSKLKFWRPPTLKTLARTSNRAARARSEESLGTKKNQRDANAMLRLATHHDLSMLNTYQLFLELHKSAKIYNQKPPRLFQKVDHTWALPPSRNYMWPARSRIYAKGDE